MDSNKRFDLHQIKSRDGTPLAVRSWGIPGAATVLFLHGGGQTSWAWEDSARRLAASGHYCLALDFRGHGDSGWADDYDLDHFAEDVQAVIEQLCDQPPAAIGASLGGASALVLEGESEDQLFSALAMVDITPRWETSGVKRIMEFLAAHPEGFIDLKSAALAVAGYQPHRKGKDNHEGLRKNLRQRPDGRWRWHWDPHMLANAGDFAKRWTPRLEKAARGISIPLLLVSGSRSDVVSEATINEFLGLVPHAEHVSISDAHHMVAGDRNDQFTDAIIKFLGIEPDTTAQESA
jgi:pimeloyl-ACP methyl ester carboxylesterase